MAAGEQGLSDSEASFGFEPVARGRRQGLVNEVFARVAGSYDLMNDLMSGGLHRLWKDDMIAWLNPSKSSAQTLLDVAGGTGDIAQRFTRAAAAGSTAIICDISAEMIAAGRKRHLADPAIDFVQGNAESLPFEDRRFDAYTIAFGMRNVTEIGRALAEAYRVLKPGGRFLCLEFSAVDVPLLDSLYDAYSFNAIPALGAAVAGDAGSYQYLVESIRRFPEQESYAAMIRKAGFEQVRFRNLTGGIAAIHSGWRL